MANTTHTNFLAPLAAAFSRLFRWVSRVFGRPSTKQPEPIRVHADLCLAQAARRARRDAESGLPEELLQAFSAEPLAAADARYVMREPQSQQMLDAIELWRAGRNSMVAVTGPQGCGITSFLQQLEQLAGNGETLHYSQLTHRPYDVTDTLTMLAELVGCEQAVGSVEELLACINELPPAIIAIDNGHFLACRIMGANEAIRIFGAVMVATQQRHLWVLGCEQYAWRRLAYVYRADRFFTTRIELPLFSEAELGQCLASRLQAAGILPAPGAADNGMPAPLPFASRLAELCKLSNGKPDLAFAYFLGSLQLAEGDTPLELRPLVALDFSILKQLISEELFTLAEVSAHGRLTIEDHCALFRSSHEESWLLLERLYHHCLLDRHETAAGPAYCLVPLYSNVISAFLGNANYLY